LFGVSPGYQACGILVDPLLAHPRLDEAVFPAALVMLWPFRCFPFSLPFALAPFFFAFAFAFRLASFSAFRSAFSFSRSRSALASARFFFRFFSQASHFQPIGLR
jgi:hypothetical protein